MNCEVILIRAKCLLAHGKEVKVPHWEIRISRSLDLASNVMLGLWPYCLEGECG